MPIENYSPAGIEMLENLHVVIAPSVADIKAPTIAELEAGKDATCALRELEPGADASESDDKRLCRKTNAKRSGTVEYSLADTTVIINDPQAEDKFIDSLEPGGKAFVFVFPNIDFKEAIAAGNRAWAYECTVKTKVPGKLSTDDGELFGMVFGWSVQNQELHSVVAA